MNRSPSNLKLDRAIDGFTNFKMAEGLSPRSVDSYRRILKNWVHREGDKPVRDVTAADLQAYLAWMRTEYEPRRRFV